MRQYGYEHSLAVVVFDFDYFKKINDTHGHTVGDAVLVAGAKATQAALREVDIVARIGGEEFAVVLPETTLEDAEKAAERIREAFEDSVVLYGRSSIRFTASFGVTAFTPGDNWDGNFDQLLACADQASYAAKKNGRNRVETKQLAQPAESSVCSAERDGQP